MRRNCLRRRPLRCRHRFVPSPSLSRSRSLALSQVPSCSLALYRRRTVAPPRYPFEPLKMKFVTKVSIRTFAGEKRAPFRASNSTDRSRRCIHNAQVYHPSERAQCSSCRVPNILGSPSTCLRLLCVRRHLVPNRLHLPRHPQIELESRLHPPNLPRLAPIAPLDPGTERSPGCRSGTFQSPSLTESRSRAGTAAQRLSGSRRSSD